jgi:hypothetical protein
MIKITLTYDIAIGNNDEIIQNNDHGRWMRDNRFVSLGLSAKCVLKCKCWLGCLIVLLEKSVDNGGLALRYNSREHTEILLLMMLLSTLFVI